MAEARPSSYVTAASVLLPAVAIARSSMPGLRTVRYRRRWHDVRGKLRFGISVVDLQDFDPVFEVSHLGPTTRREVAPVGGVDRAPNGAIDRETWIVAALAKSAQTPFELGTFRGKTACRRAGIAPVYTHILTMTLGPQRHELKAATAGDNRDVSRFALDETGVSRFLCSETRVETRIPQPYGGNKVFDESTCQRTSESIFSDESHA